MILLWCSQLQKKSHGSIIVVYYCNEKPFSIPFFRHVFIAVAEPGCFYRGGQGGASNQSGVAQKYTLFQYKNVIDYKV